MLYKKEMASPTSFLNALFANSKLCKYTSGGFVNSGQIKVNERVYTILLCGFCRQLQGYRLVFTL